MSSLAKVFKTKTPIIGALHFMPLLGYDNYQGLAKTLSKALFDLKALEEGGVDGVIVENNYDYPHKIVTNPETVACMSVLTQKIVEKTKLPVGISVLWNDYKAALSIACVTGARFVRVPAFVDTVKTSYGVVHSNPTDVVRYRDSINARGVLLFTDIQVKHAEMLSNKSIVTSARQAIKNKSDVLIVTGKWTGDAPDLEDLQRVRKAVGDFPIVVGSGATSDNIQTLLSYADGVIVSTSLKTTKTKDKVNVRGYQDKIDKKKVTQFVRVFKKLLPQ